MCSLPHTVKQHTPLHHTPRAGPVLRNGGSTKKQAKQPHTLSRASRGLCIGELKFARARAHTLSSSRSFSLSLAHSLAVKLHPSRTLLSSLTTYFFIPAQHKFVETKGLGRWNDREQSGPRGGKCKCVSNDKHSFSRVTAAASRCARSTTCTHTHTLQYRRARVHYRRGKYCSVRLYTGARCFLPSDALLFNEYK